MFFTMKKKIAQNDIDHDKEIWDLAFNCYFS